MLVVYLHKQQKWTKLTNNLRLVPVELLQEHCSSYISKDFLLLLKDNKKISQFV